MQIKKLYVVLLTTGILTLLVTGIALVMVQPVKAQCGSQASSCKNCHEVQAKDPVNNDGTSWHQSHAFGDFCYICHAGNNQATDKVTAHTGMVSPLADIKASCAQCHPNDLQARAQVYATKLGVQLGAASTPSAAPTTAAAASSASSISATQQPIAAAQPLALQQAGVLSNDPNLVNYPQRYNENALGEKPVNWGNIILLVMIGAMLIGGGSLVLHREGWIGIYLRDKKPVEGEYPVDVVDMVPQLAKLKPAARKSLRRMLGKPDVTADFLASIDKLTEGDSDNEKE